jgi:hypothetical protein
VEEEAVVLAIQADHGWVVEEEPVVICIMTLVHLIQGKFTQ